MNIKLNPFPVLTTERLILRALYTNDGERLLRLRSDEQVNRYLDRPATTTIDEAEAFIHKIEKVIKDEVGVYWAIDLKDMPGLIGTICYWNFNHEKDIADIGYELLPDNHGKGLMQEALAAVLRYGFEVMQLKVITALVHPDNKESIKLLNRNDFKADERNDFVNKEDAGGEVIFVLKAPTSAP
jgi:ribosomal-protein-alanine N-acetyltransferase